MHITVNAQSCKLWGVTEYGGTNNIGTIYTTDGSGNNQNTFHDFGRNPGKTPLYGKLCEVNGKFYGLTHEGGIGENGILFEYDPLTATYTKKIEFSEVGTGRFPDGTLLNASNGNLYGVCSQGGVNDMGTLFEYNISSNTLIKKIDFDGTNGSYPYGALIQATNGKLYGTTYQGGIDDFGTLFEYNITTSTLTVRNEFNGIDGAYVSGGVVQRSNGKLYGLTESGGFDDFGVLYEYDPATFSYSVKFDFDGNNGAYPEGALMIASNGKLYGTASGGGTTFDGVIFEYDPPFATLNVIHDFDYTDGSVPDGDLVEVSNKLYGLTVYGGYYEYGIIFEYDLLSSQFTNEHDFDSDGAYPYGSLVPYSGNSNLYGFTSEGGVSGYGILFEFNPASSNFVSLLDFHNTLNGSYGEGSLLLASNGNIYGMSNYGGIYDWGTIFSIDTLTKIVTIIHDFDSIDGGGPYGSLIQASNGLLYGVTSEGGSFGDGVLFEFDPNTNFLTKKFNFNNVSSGRLPFGSLLQATNGKLYGMTYAGGANDYGIIFEYTISTNSFVKKLDFDYTNNGGNPHGDLMQASNGLIYGVTSQGGYDGYGTLFNFDPIANTFNTLYDFDDYSGSYPYGSLIQGANGNLYGMAALGGTYSLGVLFEYNISSNFNTVKINFNGIDGAVPTGSLLLASNGNMYGTTNAGGYHDLGILFEYNPLNDAFYINIDFDGTNGSQPLYGNLIETCGNATDISQIISETKLHVFPNPSTGEFTIRAASEGMYSVLNELGQTVQEFKLNNTNDFSTTIEGLNNGVYFIVGINNNELTREKVIVTK